MFDIQLVLQIFFWVILIGATGWLIYRFSPVYKTDALRPGELPEDEHENRQAVLRSLRRYAAANDFEVVEPLAISSQKGITDLDAVLVGWFGVLGVKCLGYGGTVYGSAEEDQWVQEINGQRRIFANPLNRAQESARILRDTLFAAKIKQVPVETVVVFTGKNTQLALPRSTGHYTVEHFNTYLHSAHFEQDKKVEVAPVAQALRQASSQQ